MVLRSSVAFEPTATSQPRALATAPARAGRECRACDGPADETCATCTAPLCPACEERCGRCDAALCSGCASAHVHPPMTIADPDLGRCDPPAACARHLACQDHQAAPHY